MGIIVQKFGGSSVENTEKLFNICKEITKEYDSGNKIIVVISAQREYYRFANKRSIKNR